MKSNLIIFVAAFAGGCLLALVVRSARYKPHAAPMPTPHAMEAPALPTATAAEVPPATVNRICPICGMDVDPSLKPALYKGHAIGFGCAACPPRFAEDPDRYGPSALKNEVAE